MRGKIILLLLETAYIVSLMGCGNLETQLIETQMIEEAVWDEEWYRSIFADICDEEIVSIVVDDFDKDGKEEAFVESANKDNYAKYLEWKKSEYFDGFFIGNAWYIHGNTCECLTEQPTEIYYLLEPGQLENIKYVPIRSWYEQAYDWTTYYIVEDGKCKQLEGTNGGTIDKDGYLYNTQRMWDETEGAYYFITTKSKYENGKFIFVEETDSRY